MHGPGLWESQEDRRRAERDHYGADFHPRLPAARHAKHERGPPPATEQMARRGWLLFQYRTRELLRQPRLQSAVIALANALLAEERIDAARTARIIDTGIAEAILT